MEKKCFILISLFAWPSFINIHKNLKELMTNTALERHRFQRPRYVKSRPLSQSFDPAVFRDSVFKLTKNIDIFMFL